MSTGDPMCPRGGICTLNCYGFCAKEKLTQIPFKQLCQDLWPGNPISWPQVFTVTSDGTKIATELQNLREENAALRADVLALWQRLGDVLSLFGGKEHLFAEQQEKLRLARALHALWKEEE